MSLAMLATFLGCQSRETAVVPDELVGVWKTAQAKYEDRSFQFTRDTLIFGIGQDHVDVHPIRKIEKTQEGQVFLYAVTYLDRREGVLNTFSFSHDPNPGGLIKLKNQSGIEWRKEGS